MLKTFRNWQSLGAFVIVAGVPDQSSLNGWMYYPTSGTYSGIAFMNHRVITAGATTLSHELGHGFGLAHTFNGISEVTACSTCYEYSPGSDDTGDLCADTPPVVKNWDCVSPLAATGANVEPCGTTGRTSWDPNPYMNISILFSF
jgi:hypothetical protein